MTTACGHAHHGHDSARRAGAGNDEMVRHQLPLHGAGAREGPELHASPRASRSRNIEEAKALGYQTRPVLLGPVTFLKLAKSKDAGFDPLSLLDRLLPVYIEVLRDSPIAGAEWVQIDEPCLVLDLDDAGAAGAAPCLCSIRQGACRSSRSCWRPISARSGDNRDTALALPVAGLHLDLVRAPEQLDDVLARLPERPRAVARRHRRPQHLARRSEPRPRPARARRRQARQGSRADRAVLLAAARADRSRRWRPTSIPRSKSWLAFAVQKIEELAALGTRARRRPRSSREPALEAPPMRRRAAPQDLAADPRCEGRGPRCRRSTTRCAAARSAFAERAEVQQQRFNLPRFPTTTIGSFPQTAEVRKARAAHAKGALSDAAYEAFLQNRDRARGALAGRASASTCWCMASSSATTWCSISASSSPASPSPRTAGCSPTARAA